MQLQIKSVKKYQPIKKLISWWAMGWVWCTAGSRLRSKLQNFYKLPKALVQSKKIWSRKKQLGAFCPQLLHEVKIWHNRSRVFVKFNVGKKLLPNYHHCAHFYVDLSESNILNQLAMIVGVHRVIILIRPPVNWLWSFGCYVTIFKKRWVEGPCPQRYCVTIL